MKKTLCKVISAALLGVSLGFLGTTAMPSYPVSASIQEDGLKNQHIYRDGDYIIAVERASYNAMIQAVWIEFDNITNIKTYIGYDAPRYVGTKEFEDGTTVTVEESEDGDGYLITYKMPKSVFPYLEDTKAMFETESFGGNTFSHYTDDNNGHWYKL